MTWKWGKWYEIAVWFFADFNVPLTNDYPARRVTLIFPRKVGKEEVTLLTSLKSFDLPIIWMSQTSFMLDKSVLPVLTCVLYSTLHSITKQMAATSISHNDFEKIVDLMFSKPRRSASHVFRKIRRCTLIWYGFCFGFNHVFSWFYLPEQIHDPVSVLQCAFNSVLLWNWRILNKNI